MDRDEERLADLLSDAVSGVEPEDRLGAIRARTRGTTMSTTSSSRRPWLFAAGGAALATAAVVTAVALLSGGPSTSPEPGPAASGSTTAAAGDSASPSESVAEPMVAVPVYYVGETPLGPRLYREFQSVPESQDATIEAGNAAVTGTPLDPDYASAWEGQSGGVEAYAEPSGSNGVIVLDLVAGTPAERPDGMSAETADLAIQQLVFTAQGVLGTRAKVQFDVDGSPAGSVLGVDTSKPIAHQPDLLALVNITTPEQGAVVSGGTLEISGVANSFEANVPWQILDGSGEAVLEGAVMAEGAYDKLYPWSGSVDVSSLPAGDYTFVASTDDPSGGEGPGPTEDTKAFTLP
jgi:Immunoglobulin-like domain of bacterial spore germination